jgi:hypothetical protein
LGTPRQASRCRSLRVRASQPIADRQLNRALHVIVNWRMLHHAKTKDYLARRRAEQKTDHEIRRCLKRYAARQLFRLMEAASAT